MAIDIVDLALDFIAAYGLVAMFILLVLDGALLLPVFPGEIILIMAVAQYGHDPAGLMLLIAVASAAALTGSLLLYGVTRGGGRRLVERYPKFFMMPRRRRERLERSFQRPAGQSLVLFLRLVPLTRILVSIPAGLARMPLVRFVVLSSIGLVTYHAGFLWITYEANRPGSAISTEKERLQDAYASPAWDYVQTNSIVTGAVLLGVGVVLSIRASVRMVRADPEESTGSLVGTLSLAVLFWGGLALAAATFADVDTVYGLAALGGVDVHAIASRLGLGPIQALLALAGISTGLGLALGRVRSAARERHQHRLWTRRVMQRVEARAGEAAAPWPPTPPTAPTLFSWTHESTVQAEPRPREEEHGHNEPQPDEDPQTRDDSPDDGSPEATDPDTEREERRTGWEFDSDADEPDADEEEE